MNLKDKVVYHVVLLLPEDIVQLSIDLNKQLIIPEGKEQFYLDLEKRPPHITLGIGAVNQKLIDNINDEVGRLTKKYEGIKLTFNSIEGKNMKSAVIGVTEKLQQFHQDVMSIVNKYKDKDILQEYFVDGVAEDELVIYTNKFDPEFINKEYFPHITLGLGEVSSLMDIDFPIIFSPTFLAVGQMGNHGGFLKEFKRFKL